MNGLNATYLIHRIKQDRKTNFVEQASKLEIDESQVPRKLEGSLA
jgi:hypothetical protein